MPKVGDVMSLMPGHRAVFRGDYVLGQPVYETEVAELPCDTSAFLLLLRLEQERDSGPEVDWLSE